MREPLEPLEIRERGVPVSIAPTPAGRAGPESWPRFRAATPARAARGSNRTASCIARATSVAIPHRLPDRDDRLRNRAAAGPRRSRPSESPADTGRASLASRRWPLRIAASCGALDLEEAASPARKESSSANPRARSQSSRARSRPFASSAIRPASKFALAEHVLHVAPNVALCLGATREPRQVHAGSHPAIGRRAARGARASRAARPAMRVATSAREAHQ